MNTCLSIIISHETFLKEKSSEILYMLKYKPISIILKIFSRIILSNIVNLSILDTYADPDLLTFLNHIFTIIISLPTEAITSYMKVIRKIKIYTILLFKCYREKLKLKLLYSNPIKNLDFLLFN